MSDDKTSFPTLDMPAQWNSFHKQFSKLGPNALSVIESFQPYQHPDPDHNLLFVLSKLWNYDKHRDIVLTGTCLSGVSHKNTPSGVIPMMTLGVIRDGDVILRLPLAGTANFESEFVFAVTFGEGSPAAIAGGSVTSILGLVFEYVEDTVLPAFVELFR